MSKRTESKRLARRRCGELWSPTLMKYTVAMLVVFLMATFVGCVSIADLTYYVPEDCNDDGGLRDADIPDICPPDAGGTQ
jgi:hypothetical protein